jgi:hypothetical protein
MKNEQGFLNARFIRRLEWKEEGDGRVVVLRPRFGENKLGRWLVSTFGMTDYSIRLDDIGSAIWKNCDGVATAADISRILRKEFGEEVEPTEQRLKEFITQMIRGRMIKVEQGVTG